MLLAAVVLMLPWFGVWVKSRSDLAAENLALRSQLALFHHQALTKKRPAARVTSGFRLLWAVLSRVRADWREHLVVVRPETVIRWHRRGFKAFWRWKSKKRAGRPRVDAEMRALIRRFNEENPLWSAERIRDHLKLLGFDPPSSNTIRKYMKRPLSRPGQRQAWSTFLRNHMSETWAIDFFTVPTLTFRMLHVFVVLDHARRRVVHFNVTEHPTMEWTIQQLREVMCSDRQPRFVVRDNDGIYGSGVPAFLKACHVQELRTAYRSPWQNPYVERLIGTLRRELLNHIIPWNERHLRRLLKDYIENYYHRARPHQSLDGKPPNKEPVVVPIGESSTKSDTTRLAAIPVVGGLHHLYYRVAA